MKITAESQRFLQLQDNIQSYVNATDLLQNWLMSKQNSS